MNISATLPSRPKLQTVKKMAVAVLARPGSFELREAAVPEPGPGQVRVKIEGCGICSSSLSAWEGKPWFHYPFPAGAPGHEAWGRIDALGEDVEGLVEGERVGMLSHHAYAAYDVADTHALVRLPETLDDQPFPAEPLGAVANIFRRSGINKGDTVAIVGIGFMGALLTQLAALTETKVIAISRRPYALRLAERFGAAHGISMHEMEERWETIDAVKAATGGSLCDVVIEATGKQGALDLAAELTRERGRLVVAGYHQDGPRRINMQLWNWRGIDVINAHDHSASVRRDGMREAVRAVESGLITPAPLYTHRFQLDDLGNAFQHCSDRPDGFMKGLVVV